MKLETIESLRNKGILTLVECDESEKFKNANVVKDTNTGKWYKINETDEELKIELLAKCFQCVSTIKNIMVGFTALICTLYAFTIFLSLIISVQNK